MKFNVTPRTAAAPGREVCLSDRGGGRCSGGGWLLLLVLGMLFLPGRAMAMVQVCSTLHSVVRFPVTEGDGTIVGYIESHQYTDECHYFSEVSDFYSPQSTGALGNSLPGGGRWGDDRSIARSVVNEIKSDSSCPTTDHPVVIATGYKILPELDFRFGVDVDMAAGTRLYNQRNLAFGIFGKNWSSGLEYGLTFE